MINARYKRPSAALKNRSTPNIVIENKVGQSIVSTLLTVLPAIFTPIAVAYISYNINSSSIDKDYVSLAINILNSNSSTPDNRKWATTILTKFSPVPMSSQSEKQLSATGGITTGPILVAPLFGPKNPVIKKGNPNFSRCPAIQGPKGNWTDKDEADYILKIGKAYGDCAGKQALAVQIIDILQSTDKTPASIQFTTPKKYYTTYHLRSQN